LENYIHKLDSGGQTLGNELQNYYEPRFGYDFSAVRIHNNAAAAESAESINALAYTSGNNIVFNNGEYAPGTQSGKKLLGHELTHVVQQSSLTNTVQTKPKKIESIKRPKLSFYQADDDAAKFFKGEATKKAREIGAITMPLGESKCPETVSIGPTPYYSGKEIVDTITYASKCTGKGVQEIHIFSHGIRDGGGVAATPLLVTKGWVTKTLNADDRTRGAVGVADVNMDSLSESAVFVFHGCEIGVGDNSFAEQLLKHIVGVKTKAKVFAHRLSGVCGRYKDWIEFNKANQEGKIRSANPYHKEEEVKKTTK
jgi:hypothetical protein